MELLEFLKDGRVGLDDLKSLNIVIVQKCA
jgi:hypothetical protein